VEVDTFAIEAGTLLTTTFASAVRGDVVEELEACVQLLGQGKTFEPKITWVLEVVELSGFVGLEVGTLEELLPPVVFLGFNRSLLFLDAQMN
jgi:hypothetical protein